MGTITKRKRADGSVAHMARIRIKEGGVVVHSETETFDRDQAARLWLSKREAQLGAPGALERIRAPDPMFSEVIEKYVTESRKPLRRTKMQVLNTVKAAPISRRIGSTITSADWVAYARSLKVQPQTVGNYLSHIGAVYRLAKPAWGYPLDPAVVKNAATACRALGLVTKSAQRDRRPSLDELDRLLSHFQRSTRRGAMPMAEIIVYALFSCRRLEEITRQTFGDLDEEHAEIWVRDMKHPGEKDGNDVRCALTPEAMSIIRHRRAAGTGEGLIFPYNAKSVSSNFTRHCSLLGIDDLHFHDLRHEGVSRLFELGWTIPQVAAVSAHRAWSSLKRYTHVRLRGDKYADWSWFQRLGIQIDKKSLERDKL